MPLGSQWWVPLSVWGWGGGWAQRLILLVGGGSSQGFLSVGLDVVEALRHYVVMMMIAFIIFLGEIM